eukprot:9792143-Lingulodinium_polyedra.AAC.1
MLSGTPQEAEELAALVLGRIHGGIESEDVLLRTADYAVAKLQKCFCNAYGEKHNTANRIRSCARA